MSAHSVVSKFFGVTLGVGEAASAAAPDRDLYLKLYSFLACTVGKGLDV